MGNIFDIGGSIIGAIGNIIGQGMANKANKEQNALNRQWQQQMLGLQHQYNEESAENAMQRQIQMYNEFQSPEALVGQLKDAGLSVGMMYGEGGQGGHMASAPQAQGVSLPNSNNIPMQNVMDAQVAMMIANATKLAAETRKTNAEANNEEEKSGQNTAITEEIRQRITESQQRIAESNERINTLVKQQENIIADTALKEAQGDLTKAQKIKEEKLTELHQAQKEFQEAQTTLANIDIKYRGQMNQAQINQMNAAAKQYLAAAEKMNLETEVLNEQKDALILKAEMEACMAEFEKNEIQPMEAQKLEAQLKDLNNKIQSDGWTNAAWQDAEALLGKAGAGYLKEFMGMLSFGGHASGK